MHANGPTLNAMSRQMIGCAMTVRNTLGCGFLEEVYENALALELRQAGLALDQRRGITVTYKGSVVGEYFADLLVEDEIIVELKRCRRLTARIARNVWITCTHHDGEPPAESQSTCGLV